MFTIQEDNNQRLGFSFSIAVTLHVLILWLLYVSASIDQGKGKVIANVELLQTHLSAEDIVAPPEPKNMWQKIQQALPINRPGADGPKESPLDTMRKIAANTSVSEPKLVDKAEPLPQSAKLPELKQQRDTKLGELMEMSKGDQRRMQQLLVQEQALADRKEPIARPIAPDNPIALEEVGMKRSEKIADIAPKQEKKSGPALQEMAQGSRLTEKKDELRRKLAALGAEPGIRLNTNEDLRKLPPVTNVIGTVKERQKAQEILALQHTIKDKDPGERPTGGGDNGWANGTLRPVPQHMGKQDVIQLNEAKEPLPASKAPGSHMIDKMKQMGSVSKIIDVNKGPVELSGPIEKRKIVAAYVPRYPDWAARKGIEADVMIRFYVNAAGRVMPDIVLVKTSGYHELDQISIESLKQWVFAPLESNEAQKEQWGIITIRFKLE